MGNSSFLTPTGRLKTDFKKVLLNPDNLQKYDSFLQCLQANNSVVDAHAYDEFVAQFSDELIDQIMYFSLCLYQKMVLFGDYGEAGKDQVEQSFMRVILNIKPKDSITYHHFSLFESKLYQLLEKYQLLGLTKDQIEVCYEKFVIQCCGCRFDFHDISYLNSILMFIGSSLFIQGGFYGYDQEVILGKGRSFKKGEYLVVFFEQEIIRSPNTVVAMAAVIGDQQIFVREVSLKTIFVQKWMPVFFPELGYGWYQSSEMAFSLSKAIKEKVVSRYEDDKQLGVEPLKSCFIKDMGETVFHHELGHGVIQYHYLNQEIATFSEVTKLCGEVVTIGILEALADLAPCRDAIEGPFLNMATVAKTDPARAERMFYMYLSDIWFYDTHDTYMFLYSDLIILSIFS